MGGKSNSSTGHKKNSSELEYNSVAYIVNVYVSPVISEFSSLMTDRSDVF